MLNNYTAHTENVYINATIFRGLTVTLEGAVSHCAEEGLNLLHI